MDENSEEAKKLMEQLKKKAFTMELTEKQKAFCTDAILKIHLRARKWNIDDSMVILKESLEWRGNNQALLDSLKCTCCAAEPGRHVIELVGKDKLGRPVIFIRSYLFSFSDQTPLYCQEHLVAACERAIRLMDEGVETWVLMVDLDGFGTKDMNMAIFKDAVKVLQVAYRGRLGKALILNTPSIFPTFYKLCRPFIKAATYVKTEFANNLEKSFAENFDEDLSQKILKHIKETRKDTTMQQLAEKLKEIRVHAPNDPFFNTDEHGNVKS